MRTINELRVLQLEAKQKEEKESLGELAPEMLETLTMAAIRIAHLIYKMDGETVKKEGLVNIRGKNGEDELNEIYRLISKAGGE